MFEKIGQAIVVVVLACALLVLYGVLLGFPTKWLWNWLMPDLFGLKIIDFWQAWGLTILGGLLFKSSNTSSNKG